ncbi:NADH-quinone oxidoreductase subunit L, partial [Rhodococcus sp. IEGM 1379]|nr:NADH-quinone oxidoreductase subunit L [Rhodococcus sp. IEGM 1379]
IIGVPPFAGFFSKDKIIEVAIGEGGLKGIVLGIVTLLGAGLTAFYMTRVMLMTFFGKPRWENQEPHESPAVMTSPMILLAVGSVVGGILLTVGSSLQNWLEPVVGSHHVEPPIPAWSITALALIVVAAGVGVAYREYATREIPREAPTSVSPLTVAARRDLYGDAFNEAVFMKPGQQLTQALEVVDTKGIDGIVNSFAVVVTGLSTLVRRLQTGFVRSYALVMFVGATLVVATMMAVTLW